MKFLIIVVIAILIIENIFKKNKTQSYPDFYRNPDRPVSSASHHNSVSNEIDISRLSDSRDRHYILAQEDEIILQQAQSSVKKVVACHQDIDLSLDFFDKVEKLVRASEDIRKNANVTHIHDSAFHYYSELWYRSVIASDMLECAEQIVGNKVMYLHKINFDSITPEQRKTVIQLQRDLPKYQSLLAKKKIALWNNNKNLKEIIRASGARGRQWYNDLNERIKQKKLAQR